MAEKWGPDRIAGHLATVGDGSITIAPATVHRILMRHGISRLTDNGPAYRSKVFTDSLTHTGTAHKFTRPHTPRTNGKVESFNLPMKVEWLYVRPYASDEERTAALADFLNTYNHERPHSALGNKPPASRVPITTYRLAPQSGNFARPRIEGLGYEPTLFDLL